MHPALGGILLAALLGVGMLLAPFLASATAAGRPSGSRPRGINYPGGHAATAVPSLSIPLSTPLPPPITSTLPTHAPDRSTYTIQPGDTLSTLASRFGTTVVALVATNHLETNTIYAGQVLSIPDGVGEASPPPILTPVPAAPPPDPPQAAGGTKVLDNPNNTVPPDLDPNRPYGPPVIRTDWVISKDYAAHGGHSEWGAVDFAYWYDKDAMGSPVVATHAGRVHLIPDDPIYGNWIWVVNEHYTTRYGHTRKYLVTEGQPVVRGILLAEMGSTGHSTGPHADYQVWQDNDNKNPMDFLK